MTQAAHYEPRGFSPTGLGVVIAMHVAALGALALIKGPEFLTPAPPLDTYDVPMPPQPEVEPQPDRSRDEPERRAVLEREIPIIPPVPNDDLVMRDDPGPPLRADDVGTGRGTGTVEDRPEFPSPVRVDAQWDPRFVADRQPPYPPSEHRAQRDGSVRIELTIGTDGRVKAIRRLSATSDAFWRATERHARAHWRFRPATLDGRPVESSKVMTIDFRIEA